MTKTPTTKAERLAEKVRAIGAYQLAGLADTFQPDSNESAGADLLHRVAENLAEAIVWETDEENRTIAEALDYIADERLHEIADGAVPIYTHEMWSAFTDLGAWQEDPTELGADASDMDAAARACLYMIADRLVSALLTEELSA